MKLCHNANAQKCKSSSKLGYVGLMYGKKSVYTREGTVFIDSS